MAFGAAHGDEQEGGELGGVEDYHDCLIMEPERVISQQDDDDAAMERLLTQCEVTTFRASGPGGQHRNRRESAVRLHHLPSGIVVVATERRSQHQNKAVALQRLARRLKERARVRKPRVATRATAASRERRLKEKKAAARIKAGRRGGRSGED